jgi:hypothetical protein
MLLSRGENGEYGEVGRGKEENNTDTEPYPRFWVHCITPEGSEPYLNRYAVV